MFRNEGMNCPMWGNDSKYGGNMKRIICLICVLVLFSMGSMETYAAYRTDIYENNNGIYGESRENEGNEGDKENEGNEGNETTSPDDGKEDPTYVLIVGNSFSMTKVSSKVTLSVEKPLMELAEGEGHNLQVTTLAHGSAKLSQYAGMEAEYVSYYGELLNLLTNRKWDYVIFQEKTTYPISNLETDTVPALERLHRMVNALQPQAKQLLYMNAGFSNGNKIKVDGVNRLLTTEEMSLRLAIAFKDLENRLGIDAVMVGMHSRRIDRLYPWIKLTREDDRHPTYAGYFLAASCFYYKIYGKTPNPWKASLTNSDISTDDLTLISALPIDYLMINKRNVLLEVGETTTVQAAASSRLWQSYDITYKSLDSSVASVNAQTGLITAKKTGNTVIYAEGADGLLAFCSVAVEMPLSFARQYYYAGKGDRFLIMPQGNKTNLKWHSGNKNVATVDAATGLVTVMAAGKVNIKVINKDNESDQAYYVLYVQLDRPQNVTAKSMGNVAAKKKTGRIKVSWKAVSGAKSYNIYRSTKKNGTYKLIGTSNKRYYVDKTAAVNKNYFYKVEAKNAYKYCTSPISKRTAAAKVKRKRK